MLAFISAAVIFLTSHSATAAEQAPRMAHVGVLIPEAQRPESQVIKGLRDRLRELGYRERKDLLLEIRDAKGNRETLKPMMSELLSRKVNVVVTTGTRATQVARDATKEVPVVFSHPADPVALGLVKSAEQPGGNITGVAAFAQEMTGKRLEIMKQIVPKVRRLHIFYDGNNQFSRDNFAAAQKAAVKMGFQVADRPVKSSDELRKSLSELQKRDDDGLFHVPDDLVEGQADFIFDIGREKALPTMFNEEIWAIKGALAAYGPSYYQMGRQAADLVGKILKGTRPENLVVERLKKFDLVVNYRTATAIGLFIPPEILKRADKVIR